jgi:hypothetical protein
VLVLYRYPYAICLRPDIIQYLIADEYTKSDDKSLDEGMANV